MRVENEKRIFEISVLFSSSTLANEEIQQKTEQELLKIPIGYNRYHFDFFAWDFIICKLKEQKFQKKIRRSLAYFYTYVYWNNCNHNNFY